MNKEEKAQVLEQYKDACEQFAKYDKIKKELKALIQLQIQPGKYGDYFMSFEERHVKAYEVQARVDLIIKVVKL